MDGGFQREEFGVPIAVQAFEGGSCLNILSFACRFVEGSFSKGEAATAALTLRT